MLCLGLYSSVVDPVLWLREPDPLKIPKLLHLVSGWILNSVSGLDSYPVSINITIDFFKSSLWVQLRTISLVVGPDPDLKTV